MRAVLLDLDGVIYNDNQLIGGADETIAWLRRRRIPLRFVTNTTSRSRRQLVGELEDLGITVQANEIFTPAMEACRWLKSHKIRRPVLFISDRLREEFADLPDTDNDDPVDAVIIGNLGRNWDFDLLNQAFRLLMQTPAPRLIALGKPRYWLVRDQLRLDSGPFVAALEYATGLRAVILGKPARSFYRAALDELRVAPGDAVMIGDDLIGDIDGAQRAGLHGILVRTGKFRPQDLGQEIRPQVVLDSIAQLPAWWQEQVG